MSKSFGNGVSRTLDPFQRQFLTAVFQKGKPPLDSEMNLAQQIPEELVRQLTSSQVPSGFFLDPTNNSGDFQTDESWSNYFVLGSAETTDEEPVLWANVNGWLIPVAGTQLSSAMGYVNNKIRLYPPPSSDTRVDFVFLEVWMASVAPNPSEVNKPAADKVWKYGNVEYIQTNIDDDFQDTSIGIETTERIQLQYRIRVIGQGQGLGSSVSLDVYPDGLGDPNILGQGTATSPVSGMTYSNMGEELNDAGLWRCGDGDSNNDLGTIDGYSYAIPICAIFRRNSSTFTAINTGGNPNQNGAFDRNPSAVLLTDPLDGVKTFTTPTLVNDLDDSTTGVIQVNNLSSSVLADTNLTLSNTFLVIDDEIIGISAVDTVSSPGEVTIATTGRGRGGSHATTHTADTEIHIYNVRPDGLWADQIASTDIYDLRHGINVGDWDYDRLLAHNLYALLENRLRSTWKISGGGGTEGTLVQEVGFMYADGSVSVPNQTEALDGPDGVRTVFSDAATMETDVTVLCDNAFTVSGGFTTTTLDASVNWETGADFKPLAFINNLDNTVDQDSYVNGSIIFLHIGGTTGALGARATFRDGSERAVRFVSPREYWKKYNPQSQDGRQSPVQLRWQLMRAMYPEAPGEDGVASDPVAKHPGPMYPLKEQNFERPFLVLGGLLESNLKMSVDSETDLTTTEIDVGINFDTADAYYSLDSNSQFEDDPTAISNPLLGGRRTLYGMLTAGGVDKSGASSEVYVTMWGDTDTRDNNGAFRVIGAGTVGYTNVDASNSTSIVVEPLSASISTLVPAGAGAGIALDVEFRSQYTNSEDGSGSASDNAALAIVLTDIQGTEGDEANPWNAENLNSSGGGADLSIPSAIPSKLEINTTLLYHPGRGGLSRLPEDVWRVSLVDGNSTYLRQAKSAIDSNWSSDSGYPDGEVLFDPVHPSIWNRMRSFGLTESSRPKAPSFGGEVVDYAEIDRDHEVFVDKNSKTVVLRPYQDKSMTIRSATTDSDPSLVGSTNYPGTAVPKDGAQIFTANKTLAYPVPSEYMPRFGRQDIPYYVDTTGNGTGNFLSGINHLFKDSTTTTLPVFKIIGGADSTSGVLPMYFQTGTSSGLDYGQYGTILGNGFYQARLTNDIGDPGSCGLTTEELEVWERLQAVYSWDLGKGLQGIMLPPYLGITRLYGVYDREDYVAKGGATFQSDRATVALNPATNLLRTDVDQQTLFIFQDGAYDITIERGDHTYIIPDNVLDLTKAPSYSPGVKYRFEDFEYVVEATIFGFAKNWINENNYLLARLHPGDSTTVVDTGYSYPAYPPEADDVDMVIPAPVQINNRVYAGYSRIPYQGDPFMTRAGESRTTSDYTTRYGEVTVSNAYYLNESIQQYDSDGNRTVEIPNARTLEVLSSVDFYTTLGTGKVGGLMFPGTFTDVGFTDNSVAASSRIPATSTQSKWTVYPRTYTTGQAGNFSRAGLTISAEGAVADLVGTEITFLTVTGKLVTLTAVTSGAVSPEFNVGADTTETATNLAAEINTQDLLLSSVTARASQNKVVLEAVPTGVEGHQIKVDINVSTSVGNNVDDWVLEAPGLRSNLIPTTGNITSSTLVGGEDQRVNAGNGGSSINLTGMIERLPLGILLQDADFLGENPLVDDSSAFNTYSNRFKPLQRNLSIYQGETEYTRFLGDPGIFVSQSDGGILRYEAYNEVSSPSGTKRFRLFRGGGSCQVLSDPVPGGPLDWSLGSFPATLKPVLKGGVLLGKAMLVRNYPETAFSTETTTSHGDEIQMLVATYGILGNLDSQINGINLSGQISPAGHGEGYSACDRYRLDGHPIVNLHGDEKKEANVDQLVVYAGRETE
ncbi:MAG: hypothetical protein GF334_08795 [Candidatus Altiarchaeales archaeon]|nr:hypothetical protein [Candidatus Altiarchaeales archaeon]